MKKSVVQDKSYVFAIRIVNLYKYLVESKKEYTLSRQILKSGTAIGALVREGEQAESKADFIHKLSVAHKEANEVEYWLYLLKTQTILIHKCLIPSIKIVRKSSPCLHPY